MNIRITALTRQVNNGLRRFPYLDMRLPAVGEKEDEGQRYEHVPSAMYILNKGAPSKLSVPRFLTWGKVIE